MNKAVIPNPCVFISHASEDKNRFVLQFAQKCHENSIDTWLDEWEIKAGESIVKKISTGISDSKISVIVLSQVALTKPWVLKEIETSIFQHVKDDKKIIPLLLEECEIPVLLQTLRYIRIKDLSSFEAEFAEFKNSVFNISIKPTVTPVPVVLQKSLLNSNLTPLDNLILHAACEIVLETEDTFVQIPNLLTKLGTQFTEEEIQQSIEYLNELFLIEMMKVWGPTIIPFDVPINTFIFYLQSCYPDFNRIFNTICAYIAAEGEFKTTSVISNSLNLPRIIVFSVIEYLKNQGYLDVTKMLGTQSRINKVSVTFKRNIILQ